MFLDRKIPQIRRINKILPLYKGRGDAKCCSSCKSIKLLEHGIKVVERVFEKWLRKSVEIDKMLMGFMPEKGTIDAIFLLRQMMKCEVAERQLYNICRLGKNI